MWLIQLRNELWKLFGKKRTYIGFLMFLLAQNAIIMIFRFSRAAGTLTRALESHGQAAAPYMSGLTIATVMVFPLAYILLPLYVTLIGGDLVAKEAEDGTLRMILARPISRFRLLLTKWCAGAIFSLILIAALGLFGLLFGTLWFGTGEGLFVTIPNEMFSLFDLKDGLHRYELAHLVMIAKAITIMGLAFMFSCFNVKPAAATILALSFVFLNFIMQNIPFFRDIQHWFLTYHLNVWQSMFSQNIQWMKLVQSLCILLGFNLSFLIIGCAAFQVRDIKS